MEREDDRRTFQIQGSYNIIIFLKLNFSCQILFDNCFKKRPQKLKNDITRMMLKHLKKITMFLFKETGVIIIILAS